MIPSPPKVLIVTKDIHSRGGVANYFRLFFKKYREDSIRIERFDIGSRSIDYYTRRRNKVRYIIKYLFDSIKLISALLSDSGKAVIQVNPSFIPVPLIRDGIILLIAKVFRRKTIVFYRGWDDNVAIKIANSSILLYIFQSIFNLSDRSIVLAERFKHVLIRLGITAEHIFVTHTMFDGELVFKYKAKLDKVAHFLFLSRISEEKGIFEIINAAKILRANGFSFQITIAGYGKDSNTVSRLKSLSREHGILDILRFKGYLDGDEKFKEYSMADIFLLPSYQEGCPNSVLEAMASGLYLISTDVGALGEIIKDGVNGKIINKRDVKDLAEKMKWVITNLESVRKMGQKNISYAFENFEADVILNEVKEIYMEVLIN